MTVPLYVGTSGWHYPRAKEGDFTWEGVFYPPKQPGRKAGPELEYYAQFFNSAEVNLTFYQLPQLRMVKGWVERTPKDFRFSVKLHQKFTHPSLYERTERAAGRMPAPLDVADIDAFRMIVDTLARGGKLGVVLMQFPYNVPPTPTNVGTIVSLARAFKPHRVALEIRTRGWRSAPHVLEELQAHNIAWVYVDQYTLRYSAIRDVSPTADSYYLRLHGRNPAWVQAKSGPERYNYLYSWAELRQIAAKFARELPKVHGAYVYFNNHAAAKAATNAFMWMALFNELQTMLPPDQLRAIYPDVNTLERYRGVALSEAGAEA